MAGRTTSYSRSPILVFLPSHAAATIVSKLGHAGYQAVVVSSVPDLFEALRSEQFELVVTIRPNIDIVRTIQSIPVINLEVFFHHALAVDRSDVNGKQFDVRAFVQRVEVLTAPRSSRLAQEKPLAKAPHLNYRTHSPGWWAAMKNLLGLCLPLRTGR